MKKSKLGIILLLLCMILTMSTTAFAETIYDDQPFEFELSSGGDKDKTNNTLKRDDANYARIEFQTFYNNTGLPCQYRLRTETPNEVACSNLYTVDSVATHRPGYWAGYGVEGNYYIFRIQTDNSSVSGPYLAYTDGYWVP